MNVATIKSLDLSSPLSHAEIGNLSTSGLSALSRQLVIIDPGVTDYQSLISVIPPKTEIYILDPNLEGIAQIGAILGNFNDIEALHIISHGADGKIHLGNSTLDNSNLDSYRTQLQQWQQALSPNADLLLYGCDIAATEIGKTFIAQLAHLTGVDVAASENLTGKGGDGVLETQVGNIETTPLSLANYEYTLASPVANADTKALPVGATKTSIQVLSNDTDADGDKLTIQSVTTPTKGGTVAIAPDIYVGGDFINAGGDPHADRIAKWDGTKWSALGMGFNNTVYEIVINGSDIYAGGWFTNAGGNLNARSIAKWDGANWSALGTGLNHIVSNIAINGSEIYAGGHFTYAGGDPNANYLAKWNGTQWSALGTGLNNTVAEIVINGSDIYAGGDFPNAGGNVNGKNIAKWDGTKWSALGTGLNSWVRNIAINGTDIYVGGNFTDAGGNLHADRIAKWNGTQWSALGTGLNNIVNEIVINGSDIYAGGFFSNAGGDANANYIAKWNGANWSALGTGLNNFVREIVINGSDIYVVGDFTDAGGNLDADRIAKWDGTKWSGLGTGLNGHVREIALDPSRYLTYTPPSPTFNGIDTFSYTITDGTTTASNTVTVVVNDAPVLDVSGTPTLTAINQNDSNNNGTLISNIIAALGGTKITDININASQGIAITGLNTTNGSWEYTTDGTNWNAFTASATSARLLASDASTRIRFVPNTGYTGTVSNAIAFAAWDQIIGTNGGTEDVTAGNTTNGTSSTFSSATETADITVNPFPTITGITSPQTDGNYGVGTVIPIAITFSQIVNVTGTPQLSLNTGTTAIYSSGSGSDTLTFNYSVAAGQNTADLDYSTTTALSLNNGTIQSVTNGNAILTLATPGEANSLGANKALIIDTIAPTVTIAQDAGQADPTAANTINYQVVFSEAVTEFDNSDIVLGGTANPTTAVVTGSGTTYNVAVSGMSTNGTVTAAVKAGAAKDAANNVSAASTSLDNTVTYDNTIPTISTINRANPNPSNAHSVNYSVTFSETVTGVDETDFTLVSTGITGASITNITGSASTYTVAVNAGTGDGTLQLNLVDDDSIKNGLNVPLGGLGASNGNSRGQIYQIDKTAPTATATVNDITTAGGTSTQFTVTYSDGMGIDRSSLGNSNLRVTGAGGFSQLATLINYTGSETITTATYAIAPPGGSWDKADNGTYAIAVEPSGVKDTANNLIAATTLGSFTVDINRAPVVETEIAPGTATATQPFSFQFPATTFTDADGDTLTYSATLDNDNPLPSWLSFNPTTRTFSGTPTASHFGSFNIKVTASDGTATVSDIFALAVSDVPNTAPVVNEAIADVTANVSAPFNFVIPGNTFSDTDGNPLTYSATLEDGSPLPSWLSFDATTYTFTGTPTVNNLGNISIKITVSDGSFSVSDTFILTVSETATPPEEPPAETPNAVPVVEKALSSPNAIVFQPFSFTIPGDAFSDADGDTLTYTATLANGGPLPEWLQFEPSTGTFSGLPTQDAIGNLTIKLTASDGTATVETELTVNVLSEPAIISGPWGPIGPPTFAAYLRKNPNSQAVALPDLTAICHGETAYPGPNVTEITIDGSETDDNLTGGDRAETFNGFGGNDFLQGLSGNDNLLGSEGNDLIHGNPGNDYIEGGNGNDVIHAGKDDDVILGGEGDDELYGNLGNDVILGGNGNDFANGNQGNDWVDGGDGNDILHGGKDDDTLKGGNGTDILFGDLGNDLICAGSGNDFVYGNQGDDTLEGGDGDDVIYGGKDNDILMGGNGDDWLFGDLGHDIVAGGAGGDRFVIRPNAGVDLIVDFTDGEDLIGLTEGLTFNNLTLAPEQNSTWIYAGNELLAILNGVDISDMNQQDFFMVG
ncbi:DUF4347 domain-containing protein [Laspinema sp. D1]|uniref:DUF4347 domain-containing protein n=1 Tax=Laspinema palackyanum D2a TaxID=2953684 RepID=A0ABT2MSG9_9CYAN|nr:DUF4347 domain-containing protein [Laspinema sp. D2a]